MAEDGGGFFGGLASGAGSGIKAVQDQRTQQLEQQKQKALEANQAKEQATKQIAATIDHINEVIKATAANGNDPKSVKAAIDPLVQSAQGLAQAVGLDPNYVPMTVGALMARPASAYEHKVVKTGTSPTGADQYGVLSTRGDAFKVTPLSPGSDINLTGPGKTITGVDVQPLQNNPVTAPSAPTSQAPAGSVNSPDTPATPASLASPTQPAATPPPAAPAATDPSAPLMLAPSKIPLPQNLTPGPDAISYAIAHNVTGSEFLKAVPPDSRNNVLDILSYKMDPEKLSKRIPKGQSQSEFSRTMSWAHQASNGEYDVKYYKPMQAAVKEFLAGGQQSPAGQMTAGNTALAHGAEVADAVDGLAEVPGLLDKIAKSNTPLVSYAANALKNQAVRGTSEGVALARFLTASNHFSDETTKFYAGGQPAEAGRERVLANFDAAKSPVEIYSSLMSEMHLMSGKVSALQDRWKNSQLGPKLSDQLFRNTIPDFPILSERSEQAMDRVSNGFMKLKAPNGTVPSGAKIIPFDQYFGTK